MKKLLTILLVFVGFHCIGQRPTVNIRLPHGLLPNDTSHLSIRIDNIQTDTASVVAAASQTAFTFPTVPASYKDFQIFVNSCKIKAITDFTKSGNIITIPATIEGDLVEYVRIK